MLTTRVRVAHHAAPLRLPAMERGGHHRAPLAVTEEVERPPMRLGVLMLDTRFTRFVGDIGNPQSHDGPVLFEVVRGATVDKVVPAKAPPLIDDFIAAGERLIGRGADAITTGCGFLVLNQAELAARLAVPVATSALLLIPTLMQAPAGGQAARRADVLGARSDACAFRRRRCADRHAGRGCRAGRRLSERDLRAAMRGQRRRRARRRSSRRRGG